MTCPNCRHANPTGSRFCNNCGTHLEPVSPADGERRLVTILFADVVGSTAWAERVDPEEWTEIMNAGLRFMIRAVDRYEGTVARLMGDGLLALFGAPVAHEDDAERAVLAALAIRDSAAEYAVALEPRYGAKFDVRVGVNTGLSVLARVGDESKGEYTAMGDSANLAARFQTLAPPQGIVIGADTAALVAHAFELRPRGHEAIRGRSETVAAYDVIGPCESDGARGPLRTESPLIGRDAERDALRAAVARAAEGRSGVLFLVGEAGLGKSRLLAELKATEPAVTWLEGRAIAYASSAPYHPWRQPLLDSLGVGPSAAATEVVAKLAALHETPAVGPGAGTGEANAPAWFAALEALLGVDDPAAEQLGEAREATAQIAAGVGAHLARLGEDRPVVLVLEDLHWADHASLELVESLTQRLETARVLVVCAMRPERSSRAWDLLERLTGGSGQGGAAQVVHLAALDPERTEDLLERLLGSDALPAATRGAILAKVDGNPFYLEEVVRALVDSGHVVRVNGRWLAAGKITEVAVPDTLAGVLGARIDRLGDDERQVIQTAAAVGREFGTRLLYRVMNGPAAGVTELERRLSRLTTEGFLTDIAPTRFADHRFKHEFTRDAAYGRLLMRRRRELHARIGEEMEALFGADPEVAKDLAHHYRLGARWLAAARWSLAASRQARRYYQPTDALELAEGALEALDRLAGAATGAGEAAAGAGEPTADPTADPATALRAEVLGELVTLGMQLRQHEDPALRPRLLERAQHAMELSRLGTDARTLVVSLVNLGHLNVLSGFPATGFGWLTEAHDLATELGDDKLFLFPFWVATEIMLDDAPAAAVEQFDKVIELARQVGTKDIEAHALGSKALALARLGDFAGALRVGPEAFAAAEASGSVIKRADVEMLLGNALMEMGRLGPAVEHALRGTDLALSVNGLECATNGLHLLGLGHMQTDRLDDAVKDLLRSIESASGTAMERGLHNVRAALASARFRAGDHGAVTEMEREVENAVALNDGFGAARARLALGEALTSLGQGERAVSQLRQVADWAMARQMVPFALRAYRALAEAAAAEGDDPARDAALARAEALAGRIRWPAEGAELLLTAPPRVPNNAAEPGAA